MNPCVIAINSAPRKKGGYLGQMLENFQHHAGIGEMPIFVQYDADNEGASATLEMFINVADQFPGHDCLLFEDDVIGCKNALAAAAQVRIPPRFGILSFFNSRERFTKYHGNVDVTAYDPCCGQNMRTAKMIAGIYARDVENGFMFGQALKVSAAFVDFASKLKPKKFMGKFRPMWRDQHLGNVAQLFGAQYNGLVAPNWFQHVGLDSAIDGESDRAAGIESGNWPGLEHDALEDLDECIANTSKLRF